ncbi:hypothetical protein, partial [Sphingobacterium sp. LRF_L2]|uniref:hypothetical protein n=1 Tax=Sphingobacterium sp. LRF_L2 TaxID=3369421 RepID=UPI003F5E904B
RPSLAEWCKGRKLDLFPPSFPHLFLKTIPQGAGRLHDIFTETVLFLRSWGFIRLFLVCSWVVLVQGQVRARSILGLFLFRS